MRLYRRVVGCIANHRYEIDELRQPLRFETDGDLVELLLDDFAICVARWQPATATSGPVSQPVTLSSSGLLHGASYVVSTGRPLDYQITHVNGDPTPIRLTVRGIIPRPIETDSTEWPGRISAIRVRYELLDELGQVIRDGHLRTDSHLARYDSAAIGSDQMSVSEQATYFFSLAPEVSTLRLACEQGVVVATAASRPQKMLRMFRVPEELGVFEDQDEIRRTWFLFKPVDDERRTAENLCANICIQTRPFMPRDDLINGLYEWQDFRPVEFSLGHFVLTKRNAVTEIRDETRSTAYVRIPINQDLSMRWFAKDASGDVRPGFIYMSTRLSEGRIRVIVDKTVIQELARERVVERSFCLRYNRSISRIRCASSRRAERSCL